jgi:hypothetical protein
VGLRGGEAADAHRGDRIGGQALSVGIGQTVEGERRGAQAVVAEDGGRTIRVDQHEGGGDALGAVLGRE